eukprot:TRINITY_DN43994_c0_g1_i1.p1 TRINITY_DN43994_c0_g1~~TRINITY_DN43994_c0_g1_i1.p1  ORF type:complete len:739 (+),score=63.65 TRINITY_DN43994_c0_g1_i1:125-2341(+)
MKFGLVFEEHQESDLKQYYLRYKLLKDRAQGISSGRIQELEPSPLRRPASPVLERFRDDRSPRSPPHNPVRESPHARLLLANRTISQETELSSTKNHLVEEWRHELENETARVSAFVEAAVGRLEQQLVALSSVSRSMLEPVEEASPRGAGTNTDESCEPARNASRRRDELWLQDAIFRAEIESQRLRKFIDINRVAVYKVLKAHDKAFKTTVGVESLLPRLTTEGGIGRCLPQLDTFDDNLRKLVLENSASSGIDLNLQTLITSLRVNWERGRSRSDQGGGIDLRFSQSGHFSEKFLWFFMGSTVALFIGIIVVILGPHVEEPGEPFSYAYFLTPFPVFRLGLSILLTFWGLGAVTYCCDVNHVNYLFLVGLDPRFTTCPSYFFSKAAALTSIWILSFGMYVIDYKWMILPFDGKGGANPRTSRHYVLYPSLMLVAFFITLVWPDKHRDLRGKFRLLKTLCRIVLAPLFAVSFGDNLVGDVLTSLPKPMEDIPPVFCYMSSHHPQTKNSVRRFHEHGDACPKWVHQFVHPAIAFLPYWFRAMQCLRRYYDTKQRRHLLNFGKYVASMVVVFVSTCDASQTGLIVAVSLFATVYAFAWDIIMDWGLTWRSFIPCPQNVGVEDAAAGEERATVVTCSSQVTHHPRQRVERVFGPWVYLVSAAFDLFARMSWVTTLLQIEILTNDQVQREVVLVILSAVEIARRSLWAIIRIENEQLTNASGFRSILWVPPKLLSCSNRA